MTPNQPEGRAGSLTAQAVLNCLVREVAGPAGRIRSEGGHLYLSLAGTGHLLRAQLRRPALAEPRVTGRVEILDGAAGWIPIGWRRLASLTSAEFHPSREHSESPEPHGVSGLEAEIAASHEFLVEVLRRRGTAARPGAVPSGPEQSLLVGHRFHPAPKSRSGPVAEALRYAPEVGAAFRLRYLAVPEEFHWERAVEPDDAARAERTLATAAGTEAPAGHHLLPVHPWQFEILRREGTALAALAAAGVRDLGELGAPVRPTSSVRTVDAGAAGFLKLSLSVQITNCLRVNPRVELTGAVAMSRLLGPVAAELGELFEGCAVLGEPSARTADLDGVDGVDGGFTGLGDRLGVILRAPLDTVLPAGVRAVPAAVLVEPWPDPETAATLRRLGARSERLLAWWTAYLELLVPPVLHAFAAHGVVFEAHLQNVVVGLGPDGFPVRMVLRDLEGVKLTGPRHLDEVERLPDDVLDHLRYPADLGWQRVAYCLLVNHVSGVLAALADRAPAAEPALWRQVRRTLERFRDGHARAGRGDVPRLGEVLAGAPVPAKTNLLTRARRTADRLSGYVPVRLPLAEAPGRAGARVRERGADRDRGSGGTLGRMDSGITSGTTGPEGTTRSLLWTPAAERPDLLAGPVRVAVENDPALAAAAQVAEIDPAHADTEELCAHYDVETADCANCVVVAGRRGEVTTLAACLVLATTRVDVNGTVRRHLGARKASFAPLAQVESEAGMEFGGITPVGLPQEWPLLVAEQVVGRRWVVLGSGLRRSKLRLPGTAVLTLPKAQQLPGLTG